MDIYDERAARLLPCDMTQDSRCPCRYRFAVAAALRDLGNIKDQIIHGPFTRACEHAERIERLEGLLKRLRAWDHLDGAGDGPYWKREIDAALED